MLKPFIAYLTFGIDQIEEMHGRVTVSQVEVPYHSELWNDEARKYMKTVSLFERTKVVLYPTKDGTKISFSVRGNDRFHTITQGKDDSGNDVWLVEDGSTIGSDYSCLFRGVSDGAPELNYNNKYYPTIYDQSFVKEVSCEEFEYVA